MAYTLREFYNQFRYFDIVRDGFCIAWPWTPGSDNFMYDFIEDREYFSRFVSHVSHKDLIVTNVTYRELGTSRKFVMCVETAFPPQPKPQKPRRIIE